MFLAEANPLVLLSEIIAPRRREANPVASVGMSGSDPSPPTGDDQSREQARLLAAMRTSSTPVRQYLAAMRQVPGHAAVSQISRPRRVRRR